MKTALGKTIFIILLLLLITGCKKNYIISDRGAILFQFEYVNHVKQEGDFTSENLNFYSSKVTDWMKDIGNNLAGD